MTNRVALITGGARGIGLGIAHELANAGFDLILNGMRPADSVQETLATFANATNVEYFAADIGDSLDREDLLARVKERFTRLDVLVNNAGITSVGRKDILDADEKSFDRVQAVNLKGPFFLTQLCANWMIEQRREGILTAEERPSIINISSISAEFVSVNRGDYCLSKAALGMSTKLWAARLAEFDIDVFEVQPGVIKSDMTAGVVEKYNDLISKGLTLDRRWGTPEDVGKAVAALATGNIPYATGQVLYINGGMRINRL